MRPLFRIAGIVRLAAKLLRTRAHAPGTSAQLVATVLERKSARPSVTAAASAQTLPTPQGVRAPLAAHFIAAVQAKPQAAAAAAKAVAAAPAEVAPNPLVERIKEAKRAKLSAASAPRAQVAAASTAAAPSSPLLHVASQTPSMGVSAQMVATSLNDAAIRSGLIDAPPPALSVEAPPPAIINQSLLSPAEYAARQSQHLTDLAHNLNRQQLSSAGDTPYVDPVLYKYENDLSTAGIAERKAAGKDVGGYATPEDLTHLSPQQIASAVQTDGAPWVKGYNKETKQPGPRPTHAIAMQVSSLTGTPQLPMGKKPPHNPEPRAAEYTEFGEGKAVQVTAGVRAEGVTITPLPTAPAAQATLKAAQAAVQQVGHINSQELSSAGDTPHQTHNAAAGVSSAQAGFFSHARPTATPAAAAPVASAADQPKPPESDGGLHQ